MIFERIRSLGRGENRSVKSALSIAVIYFVFASLWILISDRVIDGLFSISQTWATAQTAKGIAFVTITALLLYGLLYRQFRVRDVAERRLRETEERLKRALKASNVGLWDWNIQTDTIYFSPEWKRQIGYETHEISDRFVEWQVRVHPDDHDRIMSTIQNYLANPWPNFRNEFRFRHKDGSYLWILAQASLERDAAGEPLRMLGSHIDITAQKEAEVALRTSEEHLKAVISGTPVILFALDREGRFTLLQGQGLSDVDLVPDELLGKSLYELRETFGPSFEEDFQQALAGEEVSVVEIMDNITFDIRYSPLVSPSGDIDGVIGVATNITERIKAERLQMEIEKEHEVIALKERFIATASHDFRTPLAVIRMTVATLENFLDRISPEARIAKLKQINAQIDRMIALLDDVLTVSKANAGKIEFEPKAVDLRTFCEDVWEDFSIQAEATHRLEFDYDIDASTAALDAELLRYALINLLSNAVKYSPPQAEIRFRAAQDDGELRFEVSDQGMGIPEAEQKRLFEPFYRASNTRDIEGTGLGLSIVRSYTELHGGTVDFESTVGQGTTFVLCIPLAQA